MITGIVGTVAAVGGLILQCLQASAPPARPALPTTSRLEVMPPSNRHRFCLGHLLAHRRHSFPDRTRARTWRESLAPSAKVPSRVEDHRYPSTSAGSRTRPGPPVTGTPSTGRPARDAALLLCQRRPNSGIWPQFRALPRVP
jgi:hypothetical protein